MHAVWVLRGEATVKLVEVLEQQGRSPWPIRELARQVFQETGPSVGTLRQRGRGTGYATTYSSPLVLYGFQGK